MDSKKATVAELAGYDPNALEFFQSIIDKNPPGERQAAIDKAVGNDPYLQHLRSFGPALDKMPAQQPKLGSFESFASGVGQGVIQGTAGLPGGLVDLATKVIPGVEDTDYAGKMSKAIKDSLYSNAQPDEAAAAIGDMVGKIAAMAIPIGTISKVMKGLEAVEAISTTRPILGEALEIVTRIKVNPAKLLQQGLEATALEAQAEHPTWKGVASFLALDAVIRSKMAAQFKDFILPRAYEAKGPLSDLWDVAKGGWKRESDITGLEPVLVKALRGISAESGVPEEHLVELMVGNPLQDAFRFAERLEVTKAGSAKYVTFTMDDGSTRVLRTNIDALKLAQDILNGKKATQVIGSKESLKRFESEFIAQKPNSLVDLATLEDIGKKKVSEEKIPERAISKRKYVIVQDGTRREQVNLNKASAWKRGTKGAPSIADRIRTGDLRIIAVNNVTKEDAELLSRRIWGLKRFDGEVGNQYYVFESNDPHVRMKVTDEVDGVKRSIVKVFPLQQTSPGVYGLSEAAQRNLAQDGSQIIDIGLKDVGDTVTRKGISTMASDIAASQKISQAAEQASGKVVDKAGEVGVVKSSTEATTTQPTVAEDTLGGELKVTPAEDELKDNPMNVGVDFVVAGREKSGIDYVANRYVRRMGLSKAKQVEAKQAISDVFKKVLLHEELTTEERSLVTEVLMKGLRQTVKGSEQRRLMNLFTSPQALQQLGIYRAVTIAHFVTTMPEELLGKLQTAVNFENFARDASGNIQKVLASSKWYIPELEGLSKQLHGVINMYRLGDKEAFAHEMSHLIYTLLEDADRAAFSGWAVSKYGMNVNKAELFARLFGARLVSTSERSVPKEFKALGLYNKALRFVKYAYERFLSVFREPGNPLEGIYKNVMEGGYKNPGDIPYKKMQDLFYADNYGINLRGVEYKRGAEDLGTILTGQRPQKLKFEGEYDFVGARFNEDVQFDDLSRKLLEAIDYKASVQLGEKGTVVVPVGKDAELAFKKVDATRGSIKIRYFPEDGGKPVEFELVASYGKDIKFQPHSISLATQAAGEGNIAVEGVVRVPKSYRKGLRLDQFVQAIENDNIIQAAKGIYERVSRVLGIKYGKGLRFRWENNRLAVEVPLGFEEKLSKSPLSFEEIANGVGLQTDGHLPSKTTFQRILKLVGWASDRKASGTRRLDITLTGRDSVKINFTDKRVVSYPTSKLLTSDGIATGALGKFKGTQIAAIEAKDYDTIVPLLAYMEQTGIPFTLITDTTQQSTRVAWYLRAERGALGRADQVIYTDGLLETNGTLPTKVKELLTNQYSLQSIVTPFKLPTKGLNDLKSAVSRFSVEFKARAKMAGEAGYEPTVIPDMIGLAKDRGYILEGEGGKFRLYPMTADVGDTLEFNNLTELKKYLHGEFEKPQVIAMDMHEDNILEDTFINEIEGKNKELEEAARDMQNSRVDGNPNFTAALKTGLIQAPGKFASFLDKMFASFGAPMYHASQWVEEKSMGTIPLYTRVYEPASRAVHVISHETVENIKPVLQEAEYLAAHPEEDKLVNILITHGYAKQSELLPEDLEQLKSVLDFFKPTEHQKEMAVRISNWLEDMWNGKVSNTEGAKYVEMYHPFKAYQAEKAEAKAAENMGKFTDVSRVGLPSHLKPRTGRAMFTKSDKKISQMMVSYAYAIAKHEHIYPHMQALDGMLSEIEKKSSKTFADLVALNIGRAYKDGILSGSGLPGNLVSAALSESLMNSATGGSVDNAIRLVIQWNYLSLMGLRPATAAKNLTQVPLTLFPLVGREYLSRGLKLYKEIATNPQHELNAVLEPIHAFWMGKLDEDTYRVLHDMAQGRPMHDATNWLYKKSMWMMRKAEEFNRTVSFLSGFEYAGDIANRIKAGEDIEKVIADTPLAFFGKPARDRLLKILGEGDAMAFKTEFGAEVVKSTQWVYGAGESFSLANRRWGKVLFMFGTWPSNYAAYLRRLFLSTGLDPTLAKGMTPFGKRAMMRWAMMHTTGLALWKGAGLYNSDMFFYQPAAYTGGPYMQLALDGMDAIRARGSDRKPAVKKMWSELTRMYMPASYEVRDVKRAVEHLTAGEYKDTMLTIFGTPAVDVGKNVKK